MKRFKNILYVFNVEKENETGLKKACQTAVLNKAKLGIIVTNTVTQFAMNFEERIRSQVAALNIDPGKVAVCFSHDSPKIDIVKKVIADGYDLVITVPDILSGIKKFFYGATTLALFRKCPCAIWVVKPEAIGPYKKIMAAVDPASDNPNSKTLTDNIIELAVSLNTFVLLAIVSIRVTALFLPSSLDAIAKLTVAFTLRGIIPAAIAESTITSIV